jgi:hypothetical protein
MVLYIKLSSCVWGKIKTAVVFRLLQVGREDDITKSQATKTFRSMYKTTGDEQASTLYKNSR